MKRVLLALLVLCFALSLSAAGQQAPAPAAPPQAAKANASVDADQIIENHLKARGGREKLAAVKDRTISAKLAAGGMEGTIVLQQKAPNKQHQVIEIAGQNIESWFDGEQGSRVVPNMGDTPFSKEEIEEAKTLRVVESLLDYKEHGEKVRFVGMKKVGDKELYEIEMTTPNRKEPSSLFFDNNYDLVKLISPLPVAEGPGNQELEFSDWREVNGIRHWFKLTRNTPQMSADLIVESVKDNAGLSDDVFRKK